jgi:hypothetical protein
MICGRVTIVRKHFELLYKKMKTDPKTLQQQKAYFLFQDWIANEMNAQSIPLANLVTEIRPKPTKEALHVVFKSICYSMYSKDSTTLLSKEELNECLDVYLDALEIIGVSINFPNSDRKNLLESYL